MAGRRGGRGGNFSGPARPVFCAEHFCVPTFHRPPAGVRPAARVAAGCREAGCFASLLLGITAAMVIAMLFGPRFVKWVGVTGLIAVFVNLAQWLFLKKLRRVDRHALYRARQVLRVRRGKGLPVGELAARTGLTEHALRAHEPRYRTAEIPKPRGGVRVLTIPDDATLRLQRTLLRKILDKLNADPAACGFERGLSVVDHAAPHVGRAVVVTCDVREFFPSLSAARVDAFFRRVGWDADAAALLTKLTTHEGGLPQGAPTSPRLSNLLMHKVDYTLGRLAEKLGGAYTRYADDLAFSHPDDDRRAVRQFLGTAKVALAGAGLELHPRKTKVLRRHQRQRICGLVVNDRLNLPRATRRRLRAALHRRKTTGEATLTDEQLRGWAGVLAMVARGR